FRSLARTMTWPIWAYRNIPGVARVTEASYRIVARHRMFFSFLTRLLWGRDPQPAKYVGVRWIFLRAVGLTYVIAFISLWTQIIGLIGHNGIVPANQVMPLLRSSGTSGI